MQDRIPPYPPFLKGGWGDYFRRNFWRFPLKANLTGSGLIRVRYSTARWHIEKHLMHSQRLIRMHHLTYLMNLHIFQPTASWRQAVMMKLLHLRMQSQTRALFTHSPFIPWQ